MAKRFGDQVALADLSLEVEPGEVVAILGPNGAWKSTALRCVAGVLLPDRGNALGLWPSGPVPWGQEAISFLPEEPALCPGLTALEHLWFISLAYRWMTGGSRPRSSWPGSP